MVDTNQCKVAYDGNEEEYEDFYDYSGQEGAEGEDGGTGSAASLGSIGLGSCNCLGRALRCVCCST